MSVGSIQSELSALRERVKGIPFADNPEAHAAWHEQRAKRARRRES